MFSWKLEWLLWKKYVWALIYAASWEKLSSGFMTKPNKTELYSHRKWLQAWNFGYMKFRDCSIRMIYKITISNRFVTCMHCRGLQFAAISLTSVWIAGVFIPPAKRSFRGYTVLSLSVNPWFRHSEIIFYGFAL